MSNQKNDDILDPIELELSSWKTVDVPLDTNDRLTAAMRSGWESASIGTDSQNEHTSCDAMACSPSQDARPVEVISSRRSWFIAGGTLLATAVTITMAVLLVGGEGSVYAQAIAAIGKARSIHVVALTFDSEGNLTGDRDEVWYDARRGVREQLTHPHVKRTRIDDGTYEWLYRHEANTLVKGPSRDPLGMIKDVLEPLKMLEKHGYKLDDSISAPKGLPNCRVYVSERNWDGLQWREWFWINDQDRLMRIEDYRKLEGEWQLNEQIDLQYDVAIAEERFRASFPDARLIDRTAPMKPFTADSMVASAEKLGIVIGIHDVHRLENDSVFVMSTSRPTDEVIKRLGKVDTSRYGNSAVYGDYQWGTNGRRLPDHTWQEGVYPINIARWSNGGVGYHWVLLLRANRMINKDNTMPIGLHIYARGKWQDALKKEGKPWYESQATDVMTIPVPEPTNSLDDVLDGVYQQILTMGDGTRSSPVLNMGSKKWSKEKIEKEIAGGMSEHEANRMSTGLQGFTFDTSLEQWKDSVKKRIAKAIDQ